MTGEASPALRVMALHAAIASRQSSASDITLGPKIRLTT